MDTIHIYGQVSDTTTLLTLADELAQAYKRHLDDEGAVASGDLKASVDKWEFVWKGETLQLIFKLPDHWRYIEEGRGPTQRSEGGKLYPAILEWIKVKHIVPRPRPGMLKVPTTEQLAYMITRKIHRFGYFGYDHHGKHLLQRSIDEMDISSKFVGALKDQFNRAVKVELSENLVEK